jgi:hypothetical protein
MSHRDRFDAIPDDQHTVGAHRGPRRRGRGWIVFAWAALASGALVVVGLYGMSRVSPSFSLGLFPATTASPTAGPGSTQKAVTPITDPKNVPSGVDASITILNGTKTENADEKLGEKLTGEGWKVSGTANASTRDVSDTIVYYSAGDLEGVALGLVKQLGTGSAQFSDVNPGSPITIVIGSDYKG